MISTRPLASHRPRGRAPRAAATRLVAMLVIIGVAVASAPRAAHAHGVGGITPTNYETTIATGAPGIPGVRVTAVDLSERLQLINRGPTTVTVLGYENEPYLRIGPDGTFENVRSPATYINRTLTPTGPPPARADATAPPEWRKVSSEPVARWHDHRAHWMGPKPQVVRTDPGVRHVLTDWSVPLLADGQPGGQITGRVLWVPPVSPWPWVLGAVALALILAVGARTRAWRFMWVGALLIIVGGEAALTIGSMAFSTAALIPRLFANVYNLAGFLVSVVALFAVIRKERSGASPLVLIAGLVALVGTALPGIGELSASQLPTTLAYGATRAGIAVIGGLALGLILGAAQYLRAPGVPRVHEQGEQAVSRIPAATTDNVG